MTTNELDRQTLTKLTDAFMVGFNALHRAELAHAAKAKARLQAELSTIDLLGPRVHYDTRAEGYRPDGRAW